jgi:hypothetical protein
MLPRTSRSSASKVQFLRCRKTSSRSATSAGDLPEQRVDHALQIVDSEEHDLREQELLVGAPDGHGRPGTWSGEIVSPRLRQPIRRSQVSAVAVQAGSSS